MLQDSYLSHEKLNFQIILDESKANDDQENHRAIKSKCVKKCPNENKNFTIIENRLSGNCLVAQNKDVELQNLPILNLNIESYNSLYHLRESMSFHISSFVTGMRNSLGKMLNKDNWEETDYQYTHNGHHKREITINGNHNYCECFNLYSGDNCEISPLVRNSIHHYVNKVLDQIEEEIKGQTKIEKH